MCKDSTRTVASARRAWVLQAAPPWHAISRMVYLQPCTSSTGHRPSCLQCVDLVWFDRGPEATACKGDPSHTSAHHDALRHVALSLRKTPQRAFKQAAEASTKAVQRPGVRQPTTAFSTPQAHILQKKISAHGATSTVLQSTILSPTAPYRMAMT